MGRRSVLYIKPWDNIGDVDHGKQMNLKRYADGESGCRISRSVGRKEALPIMAVFVISKDGERLMPTIRYGKVRHMLRDGKAVIRSRNPFTIQLTYETTSFVQPIEACQDTGYLHIGISVKSEAHEFVSEQRDLLFDEKAHHDDRRRYRRSRRNRLRYREARFDNRSKPKGWLAPSLKNKADRHIDLIARIAAVAPITAVTIELGEFDIQALKAIETGKPLPEGVDYQRGPRYQEQTLRSAVFHRDNHTCRICGRGLRDGAILHAHHMYYWRGRHGNSVDELITVCGKCHTPANHKPGGKLYGLDLKLPRLASAAFMNSVRWYIYNQLKVVLPEVSVRITYGAATKVARIDGCGLEKSHANDAYAMGLFHPADRAKTQYFQKCRRNNRCLELFYDARYIDIRDGKKKKAAQLGCERTNRREPRNSEKSLRKYRGKKVSAGKRAIRKQRYDLRPGDIVLFRSKRIAIKGTHCNGASAILSNGKSVTVKRLCLVSHTGAWRTYIPKD